MSVANRKRANMGPSQMQRNNYLDGGFWLSAHATKFLSFIELWAFIFAWVERIIGARRLI